MKRLFLLMLLLLTFTAGCKGPANPANNESVPLAPSQLIVVKGANALSVNLQWKDNSNNETGFRVERSVTTNSNFQALGNTSANTTLFTDNTIETGKQYYYRVRAVNSAGESSPSNTVGYKEPENNESVPLAPSQLVAAKGATALSVKLQWKDNSNNETGFRVERSVTTNSNFQVLGNTSANTTLFTDNTIETGKQYYYRVKAVNSAGESSPSNTVDYKEPENNSVPLAPSQLVATKGATALSVKLQWKDNSDNETGFRVERSVTTNSNFQALGNTSANTTLFTDNTIETGKQYYYRVKAVNSAGESNPSNTVGYLEPNPEEKKATLRIINNTPYAVINFQYEGGYGWHELVNAPSDIIPARSYKDYPFWLDGNVETLQVAIKVGFWGSSNPSDKDPRFTYTGTVTLNVNQTSQFTIAVTVQNVLSNFKNYSDWTGYYYTYNPTTYHSARLRFYSNGQWYLYKDGNYVESGNVTLVQWQDYSDLIYFKLKPAGDTIQYYYPNFKFFYKNGPPDWPQIEYVLQL